jgi:adenine phosphoribosyltransferase
MNDALSPADYIRSHIRTVPHWPAPGVMFRDITPLLANPRVFRVLIDQFVHRYFDVKPSAIAGLDARGFIIGSGVAYELNVGFVPIRKKGKLPFTTVEETYELEYGTDELHIHVDAIKPGERVLIIDDLLATGGTARAAARLVRHCEGFIVEAAFIVDLPDLKGHEKLEDDGVPVFAICEFEGD